MRTLVLTTTFPQSEQDPRGAFLRRHWEQRCRPGVHVRVLVPATRWSAGDVSGPLEVERFAYAPKRLSTLTGNFGILENVRAQPWIGALVPALWWAQRRALERSLAGERWDTVVGHMLLPTAWNVASLCSRAGVAFEIYGHGTDVDLFLRLPPHIRARGLAYLRHANAIYFPSAQKRDRFVAAIGPCARRFPLLVDAMTHCVAPPPTTVVQPPRRPEILFLGRLIRQKGVDDLIRAVSQMPRPPDLHIAGDGPERRRLERLATRLGVRARFHGFVYGEARERLLAQAGVLCVPSRETPGGLSEGTPLVISEAVCRGLPVVATEVGGIPELDLGARMHVVAAGRPDALGVALLEALARRGCGGAESEATSVIPWRR